MFTRLKEWISAAVATVLVASAVYACLYFVIKWAAFAFAEGLLGSMLVAVIEIGILVIGLCLTSFMSHAICRLPGLGTDSGPGIRIPFSLLPVGVAAVSLVFFFDLAAWLPDNVFSLKDLIIGVPVGLAVSALIGLVLGGVVWLLFFLGSRRGSAVSFTIQPVVRAARSPISFIPAVASAGIILGIGVPIRCHLLAHPFPCAALDLLFLLLAYVVFAIISSKIARRNREIEKSWHPVGILLLILGLAGIVPLIIWRPLLDATDILDLVHIAIIVSFGTAIAILVPKRRIAAGRAISIIALVTGSATLGGVLLFESLRPSLVLETRPPHWLLVDLTSQIDFDNDGYSPIYGVDCNDSDPLINPGAVELPGNGIDDNCRGGDVAAKPPWVPRPTFVPLPDEIRPPKRILLLIVDALRADRLSYAGYNKKTSPNIDRLAAAGVNFANAYSVAPTTKYAFPILFTGRYEPDILWNRETKPVSIDEENTLLAEVLKENGYSTAAFLTYYLMNKKSGYMQGFDHVDRKYARSFRWLKDRSTSNELVDRAVEWIKKHKNDNWFVLFHFMDPHHYYVEHPDIPDFGEGKSGLYDGEVFYTDRAIGRLFDKLKSMGLQDDTMIVLMADHGEMLGEHGCRIHGKNLWQEVVRIPLIISSPGVEPRKVSCVTSHCDVAPTILNLAGIDGGAFGMTTSTLLPAMLGNCDPERETMSEIKGYRALIGPRYKLIYHVHTLDQKLFDIVDDPGESRDIQKAHPDILKKMKDRLLAWEEYRNSKQLQETISRAIVDRIPPKARRFNITLSNNIELVAADLGTGRIHPKKPLRIALYLRVHERITQDCKVRVLFNQGKERLKIRGAGSHEPVGGSFPFTYFPKGRIIEDAFELTWKGKPGKVEGFFSIVCDGKRIVAPPGPNTEKYGWIELGEIELGRSSRTRRR